MAQTYVKTHTGAHAQSGLTATVSVVSATAGNHLRLNSRASSNAQVITAVSGGTGNTWQSVTEKPTDGGSDNIQEMWYCENCASGTYTVTVTYTSGSATNIEVFIDEFSGTATSSSLDQHTSGDVALGSSPVSTGTSGATTSANENIYTVAMTINGSNARPLTTPPTGYTADFSGPVNTNATQFCSAHKNVTSTGTQTASWPWTGGGANATAILATFKDSGGGGGGTVVSRAVTSSSASRVGSRAGEF